MSTINDGGPAFPFTVPFTYDPPKAMHSGMSLRDYFAGQALVAFIGQITPRDLAGGMTPERVTSKIALSAYLCADAMIAERAKEQPK